MKWTVRRSRLKGEVWIPGSKSHTIRAVAIASLAAGESVIRRPLSSEDAASSVRAYGLLGAGISAGDDVWRVKGFAGKPSVPDDVINVGNSGTTLRIAVGSGALLRDGWAVFTGDEQIRRRPLGPVVAALRNLGAEIIVTKNNDCAPVAVRGPLPGGKTTIEAVSSQFLTSLLVNCPLAEGDSEIEVTLLNEVPYVEMTLAWLDSQSIRYEREGLKRFFIRGGQSYHAFDRAIPADWSSATFFLVAGALADNEVVIKGPDLSDTQGDKAVLEYLRAMGARVELMDGGKAGILVRGGNLKGAELDLNATPDALPALAMLACFAEGTTRLVNVPQARIKETDRIAVMAAELSKLGGKLKELPDGLVIEGRRLTGGAVQGHGDHRVVMALAMAGLMTEKPVIVDTAEAAAVTFPTFPELLASLGAELDASPDE